jgi:hypothetical protein
MTGDGEAEDPRLVELEAKFEELVAKGFPDPITGRTFELSSRRLQHLTGEALTAVAMLLLGEVLADVAIGWSREYAIGDSEYCEIELGPRELIMLALRLREYYITHVWYPYRRAKRAILLGRPGSVEKLWKVAKTHGR